MKTQLDKPKPYAESQFLEGWMCGTYVVAGVFAIPCETVALTDIQEALPVLHSVTQDAKRGWWPRGISGMFLFPFYLGTDFDPKLVEWVQKRHPYRYAVWHEPVLYDIPRNSAWMRNDYGLYGSAFRPLVLKLHHRVFKAIAEISHHPFPNFINGQTTQ
jgi:hypothetical protein